MFLLAVRIVYIFIKCTSQIRHTCPYDTITDNVYKEINRKFNKLNTPSPPSPLSPCNT